MSRVDKYYKKRAVEFIDTIFDNGYFSKEVTRKDLRKLDEYLAFVMQSQVDMAVKCDQVMRKFNKEEL
jgi:hypothetical protein